MYYEKFPNTEMNKKLFLLILRTFFKKLCVEILKGYHFNMGTYLGKIYIIRKRQISKRNDKGEIVPRVDFGATNAKRLTCTPEQIERGEHVVYRTNSWWNKIVWVRPFIQRNTSYYKFKASRYGIERRIPDFYPEESLL